MKTRILILTLAAAWPAAISLAQERPPGGQPPREGERSRPPQEAGRPLMPMPFLQALDTDDDGIISADEIKNAPDSLKRLDKNGDGQLTAEEWRPAMPGAPRDGERPAGGPRDGERPKNGPRDGEARRPERKSAERPVNQPAKPETADGNRPPGEGAPRPGLPQPLLQALDADHNGTISADEIGRSAEALATLDKNNDGQLGPREYGPRPPQPPGPPKDGEGAAPKPAN